MKDYIDLIGRIALGTLFVYEAYDSIAHVGQTKALMADYGITWNQDFVLWSAVFFLVVGSVMLVLGYRSKLAAVFLLLYWLPVTFIANSFWNETGAELRIEALDFMHSLAIAGGLLLVVAHGTGRFAVRKLLATARSPR